MVTAKKYNVSVHFIALAEDAKADQKATFFGSAATHVQTGYDQISAIPELQGGYDAIGLSQGSVFLRAIAEIYPHPPMYALYYWY